ncbi:MAG: hypothetical protein Q6370_010810 [Candidatus Sigynarchaeota archaeon]
MNTRPSRIKRARAASMVPGPASTSWPMTARLSPSFRLAWMRGKSAAATASTPPGSAPARPASPRPASPRSSMVFPSRRGLINVIGRIFTFERRFSSHRRASARAGYGEALPPPRHAPARSHARAPARRRGITPARAARSPGIAAASPAAAIDYSKGIKRYLHRRVSP